MRGSLLAALCHWCGPTDQTELQLSDDPMLAPSLCSNSVRVQFNKTDCTVLLGITGL